MPDHDSSTPKSHAPPEWHDLAQKASEEPDGEKVLDLISAICDHLDEAEATKKERLRSIQPPANSSTGDGVHRGRDHSGDADGNSKR